MENKTEKKGGSKVKIIIISLLVIIVVGAGGYFGYTMFLKNKGQEAKPGVATQQPANTQQVAQQGQNPQGAANTTYLQQVVSAKTFDLDECLVNLADEDGKRYLKVKVFIGYDNKKLEAELTEKKPMIRDSVISVLRTKKAADINPKNMDNIKMEIIQKVNPMLEKAKINNVYFNDILVQ